MYVALSILLVSDVSMCLQTQQPAQVRAGQDDVEIETTTEQSDAFAVRWNILHCYDIVNIWATWAKFVQVRRK